MGSAVCEKCDFLPAKPGKKNRFKGEARDRKTSNRFISFLRRQHMPQHLWDTVITYAYQSQLLLPERIFFLQDTVALQWLHCRSVSCTAQAGTTPKSNLTTLSLKRDNLQSSSSRLIRLSLFHSLTCTTWRPWRPLLRGLSMEYKMRSSQSSASSCSLANSIALSTSFSSSIIIFRALRLLPILPGKTKEA